MYIYITNIVKINMKTQFIFYDNYITVVDYLLEHSRIKKVLQKLKENTSNLNTLILKIIETPSRTQYCYFFYLRLQKISKGN